MITHLACIRGPTNVVLRTSDTDVFIVAFDNIHKIRGDVNVFL